MGFQGAVARELVWPHAGGAAQTGRILRLAAVAQDFACGLPLGLRLAHARSTAQNATRHFRGISGR